MEESELIKKALKKFMAYGYFYIDRPFKELMSYKEFYQNKPFGNLHSPDSDIAQGFYDDYAGLCMMNNDDKFIDAIKSKRGDDLIKELNLQYFSYFESRYRRKRETNPQQWLYHTIWLIECYVKKHAKINEAIISLEYEFKEWLKTKQPVQKEISNDSRSEELENEPDKIDSDLWNENGKSLFEFLIEHYNKTKGAQKYINIFHFLKNSRSPKERTEIGFYYSVYAYKSLIKDLNGLELGPRANIPANWHNQLIFLNIHYDNWRKTFKQIENPQNTL